MPVRTRLHRTPGLAPGVFVWCLPLLLALSLVAWPLHAAECRPTAALEAVTVARVTDGDTLQLQDGRRLRLIGINAPELGRQGGAGEPFARQARAALERQLGPQRRLWLQPGLEASDRYGRLLAHAFTSAEGAGANGDSVYGHSVEAALVGAGLALQVALPPNLALAECLVAAERAARRQRAGLWEAHGAPQPVRELRPGQGGFKRVRGTVERVEQSRHSWWLELDGPLVVRLDKKDLQQFPAGDRDPRRWQQKSLVIRGWIVDRSGRVTADRKPLTVVLRHPAMLE